MNYLLCLIISLITLTSCIKTKTDEVYDDYISLGVEERFDVIRLNIDRLSDRLVEFSFHVQYGTDTIVFNIGYIDEIWRNFNPPTSLLSITSDTTQIMDENTRTHWESTSDNVDHFLYIENPLPLQFKLEYFENAEQHHTYGAKNVYLDINKNTPIVIARHSHVAKYQMETDKDKTIEIVNRLMETVNDAQPTKHGKEPFLGSGYVYMR